LLCVRDKKHLVEHITWQYRIVHLFFLNDFGILHDVWLALITCVIYGYDKKVLGAKDIAEMAKKSTM
jgi:hypothetical protein